MTADGTPLQGVSVYVGGVPTAEVAVTDEQGAFTIDNLCGDDQVTLSLQGFQLLVINLNDLQEETAMTRTSKFRV